MYQVCSRTEAPIRTPAAYIIITALTLANDDGTGRLMTDDRPMHYASARRAERNSEQMNWAGFKRGANWAVAPGLHK